MTDQDIEAVLHLLRTYGIQTPDELKVNAIADDPSDNKFIIAAVEGNADYIVSGDRHLKALKSYQQIQILSPNEFLNVPYFSSKMRDNRNISQS